MENREKAKPISSIVAAGIIPVVLLLVANQFSGSRSPVAGPVSTLAKVLLFRQKSLILLTNPGLVINFYF